MHFGRRPIRISRAIIEIETRLREAAPIREIVDELEKGLSKQAMKE